MTDRGIMSSKQEQERALAMAHVRRLADMRMRDPRMGGVARSRGGRMVSVVRGRVREGWRSHVRRCLWLPSSCGSLLLRRRHSAAVPGGGREAVLQQVLLGAEVVQPWLRLMVEAEEAVEAGR